MMALKTGPGMALRPGLAGCRGFARTSPRPAFRGSPQRLPLDTAGMRVGDDGSGDGGACEFERGVRLAVLVAKEEEQQGAKKEEQLMGGRVALAAVLAAAAVAVWQGGSARTRASTDVSLVAAPLRAEFVVRASSGAT